MFRREPPTTKSVDQSADSPPATRVAGDGVVAGALAQIGQPAPDIKLLDAAGKTASLRSLIKTRPLAVINGSYSSPIFRDRVPDLRDLRRSLGAKVDVCVVYVAEAHPAGEWDIERNRDAGISVAKHDTIEARQAAAAKARKQMQIDMPLWVDEMTDAYLRAVNDRPNAAVLIQRDGTILLFQNWFDPHALRRTVLETQS